MYSTRSILYTVSQMLIFWFFKPFLHKWHIYALLSCFLNLILYLRDYHVFIIKIFAFIFIAAYCSTVWMHSIYLIKLAKQKPFCTTACKPKIIVVEGNMSPFSPFHLNHLQFLYKKIKLSFLKYPSQTVILYIQ